MAFVLVFVLIGVIGGEIQMAMQRNSLTTNPASGVAMEASPIAQADPRHRVRIVVQFLRDVAEWHGAAERACTRAMMCTLYTPQTDPATHRDVLARPKDTYSCLSESWPTCSAAWSLLKEQTPPPEIAGAWNRWIASTIGFEEGVASMAFFFLRERDGRIPSLRDAEGDPAPSFHAWASDQGGKLGDDADALWKAKDDGLTAQAELSRWMTENRACVTEHCIVRLAMEQSPMIAPDLR